MGSSGKAEFESEFTVRYFGRRTNLREFQVTVEGILRKYGRDGGWRALLTGARDGIELTES